MILSLKLVVPLLGIAGIVGIALGYYLRLIISLGKKGSMELEVKEMLLSAKVESKKITAEADLKAKQLIDEARVEILCQLIEKFDGPISNDWSGEDYTKEQPIAYVRDYGKKP